VLVVGVVGATNEGARSDVLEAHLESGLFELFELLGTPEPDDRVVAFRGAQVLTDGEEVGADFSQVCHGFEDFGFSLAEADHHSRFRGHERVDFFYSLQELDRNIVVSTWSNFSENSSGCFDVVVEDVRSGFYDAFERFEFTFEIRD